MVRGALLAGSLLAVAVDEAWGIDNGLGLTPPMGWRSWNLFKDQVNQALIENVMRGMAARRRQVDGKPTSLCDLGYCDVGLDDAWQECTGDGVQGHQYHYHDDQGNPVVNLRRFPNMSNMTWTAHSLNLTAGWYLNNCICAEYKEGTHEMYAQDVHYLADVFNFDGVKLDGCSKQMDLNLWADLINKTGRKIVIENCHWGNTVPTRDWCPWNFFRTSGDITPCYGSVVANLQTTVKWAREGLSRPGCWAYPDMLEVGVHGLSPAETRSHFGAWCIVSSPLTLSHDVNNDDVSDAIWPIISNREAIDVNQAWAGHSGSPFRESSHWIKMGVQQWDGHWKDQWFPSWQFFYKPMPGGRVAVLMMNHDSREQTFTLRLSDTSDVPGLQCHKCHVRDVWARRDLPDVAGDFTAKVASHDTAFLVFSAKVGNHDTAKKVASHDTATLASSEEAQPRTLFA